MKLLSSIILSLFSFSASAITIEQASVVESNICKAANYNCPKMVIEQNNDDNGFASAEDFRIHIFTGLLREMKNDHEFAAFYAHELWHLINEDHRNPKYVYNKLHYEKLADMQGRKIMIRAGYNPNIAAQQYLRNHKRYGSFESGTHPSYIDRYNMYISGVPYK